MTAILKTLKWLFGLAFVLLGLGGMSTNLLASCIFLLLGFFILPPTYNYFVKKTGLKMGRGMRWVTVMVVFIIASFAIDVGNIERAEADLLVEQASELIDEGNIDSAKFCLVLAKMKYDTVVNKAVDLELELKKFNDITFAQQTISELSPQVKYQLINDDLDSNFLSQNTLNSEFLVLLKAIAINQAQMAKEEAAISASSAN